MRRGTGPSAAGQRGVTRDLRKDEPYLVFADCSISTVCLRDGGEIASPRYTCGMAEMRESLKIVAQAIENIRPGPLEWVESMSGERTCPTKKPVYQNHSKARSRTSKLSDANRGFVGSE